VIELQLINETFVADITGLDVRYVADAEFDEVYAAWLRFGVLRLRDQPVDEDALAAFSVSFGPLEENPMGPRFHEENATIRNRYVLQLSNIIVDGKPIGGLGNAEANWHSDMTYSETPPPASVLLGVEIPAEGGDTYFADQVAAYAVLPAELKTRIQDLTIKHDAAHTSTGELRAGFEAFDDPRDAPGAIHPMVLRHDETGSAALYLGRREWAYIPGLSLDESESLLDEIWSYATRPEFVWRQKWQPGDLIIWDNRRVLHRRDDFDPQSRRLMKRCQVLARTAAGAGAMQAYLAGSGKTPYNWQGE
jgi:taurine dioxygenase